MARNDEPFEPSVPSNYWGQDYYVKELAQWLIDNPDFDDRPATMEEFLGPGYLDIDPTMNSALPDNVGIRPGVKQALIEIFGTKIDPSSISEKREALFTGGIGIGKTTMASVALAYMVHWVACLHDPQSYFGLLPGSRIAFMLMSTKDSQAKEVLFGDIKARINTSKWFRENCMYDKEFKNQLRFDKDIWVLPGNSMETTFEGYNILGGILDEGDSHKVTDNKDYAEEGWRTIKARVTSRFTNPQTGEHRGLLIAIGQKKMDQGFMARTQEAMELSNVELEREGKPPRCKVVQMAIWESFGWEKYIDPATGEPDVFYYDVERKIVVPNAAALAVNSPKILRIPRSYYEDFRLNPVQALKDHAGIPPSVADPFIPTPDKLKIAQEKWLKRFPDLPEPVIGEPHKPEFDRRFMAPNPLKRTAHFDIGYAAWGDAAGFAMAHIPELVTRRGELKPVIVFDCLVRVRPSGGQQLMLSDLRNLVFQLRDKRGFRIALVTYDGFQSQDSQQILREKRFNTDTLSVDRNKGPYEDLREAIFEERIEFPKYMVEYSRKDQGKLIDIATKELLELTDTGRKIDHQPKGSKDVADCMAACTYALMLNHGFRSGARRLGDDGFESGEVPMLRDDEESSPLAPALPGEIEQQIAQSMTFGQAQSAGMASGIAAGARPLPVGGDPFSAFRAPMRW
ncbi:terminase [Rhodococcus phage Reynauld]|uniref:Terminase n=1 Tax=Rhodococcus phage Reynauld TaxID=3062845 RepID=A0ACD4UHG6_9CAUD|nr:terminase [Rhodococcus phage Reynauld]